MNIDPIGIIHTPFSNKDDCPMQPAYASGQLGRVEVLEEFAAGLKDIDSFSHIYLIYHFDRAGELQLVRPTFLDDTPRGIFASRHPCRPSGIGLSIVKLLKKEGRFLDVEGVDMLDKTPLLDIKPYIPRFDRIEEASPGWTADLAWRPKPQGRE